MAKLTAAPNLKKQPQGATQCKILAGVQAWDFANIPQAERTQAEIELNQILPTGTVEAGAIPPIVLDAKILANLTAYRIAPASVEYVEIQRANNAENLKGTHITLISDFLAKHTAAKTVVMYDEAGQLLENLSNYIQRLRQDGNQSKEIAEIVTENAQKQALANETEKRTPFIEKRTINGLRGLYRITPKYNADTDEWIESNEKWLCDVVDVVGIGRSDTDDFIVLQWQPEQSSQKVTEALPLRDLGEREGWKLLKERGLNITNTPYLRNELADYLQNLNKGNRQLWTITNATGWQKGAYILPNGEILGEPETPVLFRSQSATAKGYHTQGTTETWRANVSDYVRGNPSQMLGLAVAFASPMIALLNAESFGVHLFGGSTAGKTTTANIADSLFGNPDDIRLSWNTTALGIANEAAARNDGLLTIDEIGQITNPKHAEQIAYTLFNGVGKIQGAKDGGNRELQRWRIAAFSTGEIDLESFLKSKGIQINAGQLVRLLNVPISPAKCFHGLPDGKAHADHLNAATRANYGVVGRLWIEWLIANKSEIPTAYQAIKNKWLNRLPNDASPQVQRVAGRFAILETALHLADVFTGWGAEEIVEAVLHCFNEWINIFGLHSREERQVIEQVNGWLLRYGSRFIEIPSNPNQREPNDTAGYRLLVNERNDKEKFFIYPQVYIDDVIKGFNEKQANEILFKAGMLERSNEKPPRYRIKMPASVKKNQPRCYVLIPLDESQDDETEQKA